MLASRTVEQYRVRLAAFAVVFRLVRPEIDAVYVSASGSKLRNHLLVYLMHERLRKNVPRDPGLIRHHDNGDPGFVQSVDRLGREWKNAQTVHVVDIAHFLADGAVAVQENGPAKRMCFRHSGCSRDESVSRCAECVARQRRRNPRRSVSCSDDPPGISAENMGCRKRACESG